MSRPAAVTAVVPLRDGVTGKSRLAAALDPAARRRLVVELARRVVTVLTAADRVDRVVVVTADPAFAREVLAQVPTQATTPAFGTVVIAEPPGRPGLNAALEHAREHVRATSATPAGPGRLLVAHADLPLLTGADVGAVLAPAADVVVATDRHGVGTNLLALPTDAAFTFRFGEESRAAHTAQARDRDLSCAVVDRTGTALDLDTLRDWDELPPDEAARLRAVVGAGPA
ncbi:2-phospho-L-lactate guanylyltransferase [Isoptericola jiangsuensis]|uniref:2-phospho-L-lactate guanylyltransferase n=1 Tax=Isoptericola jiangsuensis TaxID=548579 RepID=UPI003AAB321A